MENKEDHLKQRLLSRGNLPGHIAIIMDGNGRWAKKRGLPRVAGHREGVKTVRTIVEGCGELGIKVLTLYTFSAQNWSRPKEEISALMKLLMQSLKAEQKELVEKNVRLMAIGNLDSIPEPIRKALNQVIEATSGNTGLVLVLALNYGGREEIVHAAQRIAESAGRGEITPEEVNETLVSSHLYTAGLPDPDLLIRTSGEFRISNFLLWQSAYTEIIISDVLWPDFGRIHLFEAIESYQGRERRYGKLSEQVSGRKA